MSYQDRFQQRGNIRVADVRISEWLLAPENIDNISSIARYDESAAEYIRRGGEKRFPWIEGNA